MAILRKIGQTAKVFYIFIIFALARKPQKMENFFDLAQRRRSVRKFTEQAVEQEKIDKIMQVALMSPSGKRINPWKFVLVTDKEMLQKLSEARTHGSQLIAGASLAIVVMADTSLTDVWIEDASIAASYIQLEAEDLGLGSCWVQVRNREKAEDDISTEKYIRSLLNIPEKYAIENMVAIGYKTEEKFPHDLSSLQYDKINIEKYNCLDGEKAEEPINSTNATKPTDTKSAKSHPYNKRIVLGTLLVFFGLLFFVKRLNILPESISYFCFSLKSYLIYAGVIFMALHKFGSRNLRTGILLAVIGLIFYFIDFADWIWITFNIWNYWPLIITLIGGSIVYFALKNGRNK